MSSEWISIDIVGISQSQKDAKRIRKIEINRRRKDFWNEDRKG
jgi:hypothetical protein